VTLQPELPSASIIVPVTDGWESTFRCLLSLAKGSSGVRHEAIVVDNGTSDETRTALPHLGGIRVLRNELDAGFARACNQAAADARGDVLVFLDRDVEVEAGWLEPIVKLFEDPTVAAACPSDSSGVSGAFLAVRRADLQAAGGWDESQPNADPLLSGFIQRGRRVEAIERAALHLHAPDVPPLRTSAPPVSLVAPANEPVGAIGGALEPILHEVVAVSPVEPPPVTTGRSKGPSVIIFSKDRPLQLDATLRSLLWSSYDAASLRVQVLYRASDARMEALYRRLAGEHPGIELVPEEGFQRTLARMLEGVEHVLFAVDDCLFVRRWNAAECCALLDRTPAAIGVSLRLGRNTTYCYPLDRTQPLPTFLPLQPGIVTFDWTSAADDFGYPLELSSSVYRTADVAPLLRTLSYRNPNELESGLAARARELAARRPLLLCHERSVAFCTPVNVVQSTHGNRVGTCADHSPEALAQAYAGGRRIDVDALRGYLPRGCHEEIDLPLLGPGERPPAVSVVIPCYGQAEFLPFAVSSVVMQSYTDWEIVIVDDGSPDNTAEVATRLAARAPDRAIRLVRQPNGGLARARNAGISAARGRYIVPLDADDGLDPSYLQETVDVLEADPDVAIAFTDVGRFGAQSGVWQMGPWNLETLRQRNTVVCTATYRRHVWQQVRGYNPNMVHGYEDWDFWVGCAARGHRAVHVPKPLFFYRFKEQSMVSNATRHQRQLHARIALNHPEAFTAGERASAEAHLNRVPLGTRRPSARGAGDPLVSVVIPCYGQAEFLPFAVSSVAMQTFADWEIVVVDDGSADDTAAVAERLIERLPGRQVRLLRQENAGLAEARNAGIRACRGSLILPLDADDAIPPGFLEATVAALEENPDCDVAYTDVQNFGSRDDLLRPGTFDPAHLAGGNQLAYCSLYRRDVWEGAGGYNPNMVLGYEDWDFWISAAECGFKGTRVEGTYLLYRVKPESMYTQALARDAQIRARIVLNHPSLYDEARRREAAAMLAADPLPARRGTPDREGRMASAAERQEPGDEEFEDVACVLRGLGRRAVDAAASCRDGASRQVAEAREPSFPATAAHSMAGQPRERLA